jgi:hypothetical protein
MPVMPELETPGFVLPIGACRSHERVAFLVCMGRCHDKRWCSAQSPQADRGGLPLVAAGRITLGAAAARRGSWRNWVRNARGQTA